MTVQLCSPISDPAPYLQDEDWAIEQKLDGKRVRVVIEDGEVRPCNRHGELVSHWPRALRAAMASLPGNWEFDGELVGYTYWVFDLLALPGYGRILDLPWLERRGMLDKLFATAPNIPDCLRTTIWETNVTRKEEMLERCIENNSEGVVFKHVEASHTPGRSKTWVKYKLVKTCEVVVTEMSRKGKAESIGLGLYDSNGVLQPAGGCRLLPKFMGKITLDDVVEVRYLYATEGHNKLVQPVLLGKRTDKTPAECTQDQLVMTNKDVLL